MIERALDILRATVLPGNLDVPPSSVIFNISGNDIRKGNGSSTLYNLTGRLNAV
jgi:hypothetical protein